MHVSHERSAWRERRRDVIEPELSRNLILPERRTFFGERPLGLFLLFASVIQ